MSAMDNVLVKDDAATPVEITFVPVTANPTPKWRAGLTGVPFEGQPTIELSEESLRNGGYKRQVIVGLPVMETLGASGSALGYVAPQKVAYVEKIYITQISSGRSTVSDRANLLKLAIGIMQGAYSTTGGGTLANTAAGDAWKTSTRPFPLFFTQGVIPS